MISCIRCDVMLIWMIERNVWSTSVICLWVFVQQIFVSKCTPTHHTQIHKRIGRNRNWYAVTAYSLPFSSRSTFKPLLAAGNVHWMANVTMHQTMHVIRLLMKFIDFTFLHSDATNFRILQYILETLNGKRSTNRSVSMISNNICVICIKLKIYSKHSKAVI